MAAVWFKGVQHQICLDYNDTVNELLYKYFTNSASIVNRNHQSQSLQSSLPQHTLRKKQFYTCSGAGWTGILPAVRSRSVHLN